MTRRVSKSGRAYTVGSSNGWGRDTRTPAERVCSVCGKRVTLTDSSVDHTEIGARGAVVSVSLRHAGCKPVEAVLRGTA